MRIGSRVLKFRLKRWLNSFAGMLFAIFVGFWAVAGQAEETGELGLQIGDVANKYTAAIISAKICDQYQFEGKAQEAAFLSNRELSRVYTARIFIEEQPGVAISILTAQAEQMDKNLDTQIRQFHANGGCSQELITVFLNWFKRLKAIPQQPFPRQSVSFDEFKAMAFNWLKLHSLD